VGAPFLLQQCNKFGQVAEWLKAADCMLCFIKAEIAARARNCMMKTRLIRGSLNRLMC